MLVDYFRVWQRPDVGKMGCDPADHPTAKYITDHANAYANPNLTTWAAAGYTFPVSCLLGFVRHVVVGGGRIFGDLGIDLEVNADCDIEKQFEGYLLGLDEERLMIGCLG